MKSTLSKEQIKVVEVHKFECDLCGVELESEFTSQNDDEVRIHSWTWQHEEMEFHETTPNKELYVEALDCCIDCFNNKVKPLLESHFNVKFRRHKV